MCKKCASIVRRKGRKSPQGVFKGSSADCGGKGRRNSEGVCARIRLFLVQKKKARRGTVGETNHGTPMKVNRGNLFPTDPF